MVRTPHRDGAKAGPGLEGLAGGKAQHGLGQVGLQLVEDGGSQTGRDPARDAAHAAADGVGLASDLLDQGLHRFRRDRIRAPDGVGIHRLGADGRGVDVGDDVAHLVDPGDDLDPSEDLAGDGARGDTGCGFPRGGATASLPVPQAVAGVVGVVGVAGPVQILEGFVGPGVGVLVADQETDRGPRGDPLEDTAQNLDGVGFLALGGDAGLAWASPTQLMLHRGVVQLQTWRTAFHHRSQAAPMGLAEGGDAEETTEGAPRHADAVNRRG